MQISRSTTSGPKPTKLTSGKIDLIPSPGSQALPVLVFAHMPPPPPPSQTQSQAAIKVTSNKTDHGSTNASLSTCASISSTTTT